MRANRRTLDSGQVMATHDTRIMCVTRFWKLFICGVSILAVHIDTRCKSKYGHSDIVELQMWLSLKFNVHLNITAILFAITFSIGEWEWLILGIGFSLILEFNLNQSVIIFAVKLRILARKLAWPHSHSEDRLNDFRMFSWKEYAKGK